MAESEYARRNAKHWEVRDGLIIMEIKEVPNLPYGFFPTFMRQIEGFGRVKITEENVFDSLEWHAFMETKGIGACDDILCYAMVKRWTQLSPNLSAERTVVLLDEFFRYAYRGVVHNCVETTREFVKILDQLDEDRNIRTVASAFSVDQWRLVFDLGTRVRDVGETLVEKLKKLNKNLEREITLDMLGEDFLVETTFSQVQDQVVVMVVDFLQSETTDCTSKKIGPYLKDLSKPVQLLKWNIYDFGTYVYSKGSDAASEET